MYEILFFYLLLFSLLFIFKRNVERRGILFLFKIKKKNIFHLKNEKILKILSAIVIFLGFSFLFYAIYFIFSSLIDILTKGYTEKVVTLALPGIKVPGIGKIPFIEWILSILILSIIHEFSHAFFIRSFGGKIKSIGIAILGPLLAGYVEPVEEEFERMNLFKKLAILFSGSVSNIISGFLFLFLISSVIYPLYMNTIEILPGIKVIKVIEDSPVYLSGMKEGIIIDKVDGIPVKNISQFIEYIKNKTPGSKVIFYSGNKTFSVIVGNKSGKPYYGFVFIQNYKIKEGKIFEYNIFKFLYSFFRILSMLSIGIGFANLLPIFFLDGGKAIYYILRKINEKLAKNILTILSIILIFVIIKSILWNLVQNF